MTKKWNVSLGLIGVIEVNGVEAPTRGGAMLRAAEIANRYLQGPHIVPDSRELGVTVTTLAARSVIDASDYNCVVHVHEVGR